MLGKKQVALILEANRKYNGNILPIGNKPQHDQNSFTNYGGYLCFWFETMDKSSRIVRRKING